MRTIVPVPSWDDVDVPEDGDLVRRADLVDAYQALANRDQYQAGQIGSHENAINMLNDARIEFLNRSSYAMRRLGVTGAGRTYEGGDRIDFADSSANRIPISRPASWGWSIPNRAISVPYLANTIIEVALDLTVTISGVGAHILSLNVGGSNRGLLLTDSSGTVVVREVMHFVLPAGADYRDAFVLLAGSTAEATLTESSSILIKVL